MLNIILVHINLYILRLYIRVKIFISFEETLLNNKLKYIL